jgi:hypothetical protein
MPRIALAAARGAFAVSDGVPPAFPAAYNLCALGSGAMTIRFTIGLRAD